MVTDDHVRQIMPHLPQAKRAAFLPFLQQAMAEFEINNPLREAAFLAQIAHESGEFRFMEEIWGPTGAQRRYEPPGPKAAALGNTQPGDGKRYKGRGPIQITGRANYRAFGRKIGIDIERHPEAAAIPSIGLHLALEYWASRNLNELADADDCEGITRRINGGDNGIADRKVRLAKAKELLT